MKIIHLGDLHVRLLKRHEQYRKIFSELYKKLNELKPNIIVLVGDIFHSKININNEAIEVVTNFFQNLNDISPTYIIPGNHDLLIRNLSREDSISPIIQALDLPNLHYMKYSQEMDLGDVVLNHLSIVDKDKWIKPTNKEKINIALYHGCIVGVVTDSGWTVDRGDVDLKYLSQFDYAFLGDIHKANQSLDKKGKYRYCGSLISQDFSEDNEKGFLLWNIESKKDYTCEFVPLYNPNPFVTVEIHEGKLPKELDIKEGSFVRLVSNENLSYDIVNKALDIIKVKFNPESVIFLNKSLNQKGGVSEELVEEFQQEDFHDEVVQERLIREYLKDFGIFEETIEKVLELNKRYNVSIESEEGEIIRNVNWKLKKCEWSSLFNFGENNKIDFSQLNGIVGLFGKSYSGKSSVIDSVLYTIFNSITKNARKNYNIINQNKEKGEGRVEMEIGDNIYVIERSSEKYDRRLHGKESEEARTLVNFKKINDNLGIEENLNGQDRDDTDRNIRRIFGTKDDFLLTSMSSQFGSLGFINEGSTKRKEILAKFLDLEIFDKKFKMAKEDATNLKGAIKRAGNIVEYEKIIENIKKELVDIKTTLSNQKDKCNNIKKERELLEKEVLILSKKIQDAPTEIIDIKDVEKQLKKVKKEIEDKIDLFRKEKEILKEKEELLERFKKFEQEVFDIEEYQKKQKEINDKRENIENLSRDLQSKEKEIKLYQKKTELLKEVPCGDEFKDCKFISDAFQSLDIIKEVSKTILDIKNCVLETQKQIEELNPNATEQYIDKYEKVLEKKNNLSIEIPTIQTKIAKMENELMKLEKFEGELLSKKQIYDLNKDVIENLEEISQVKKDKEAKLSDLNYELENCENEVLKLHRKYGSIEEKLESTRKNKNDLLNLRKEYEAYELLMKCCHSDGISFEIIKRRLSYINSEISKALASVVKFTCFFENNENKLDLYIKHQNFEKRPLELGSGAEKTLASLAIRLALTKITNLPRSNFLILDEPCIGLDESILESFSRFMEVLKENFEIIILISHLEALKDLVDSEIILTTKDKYASICQ